MKLYAILADIHSNYPALRAVEADARGIAQAEKVEGPYFLCLGDVVDYGPQPNKCVAWVNKHCSTVIRGNHDDVVILGPDSLFRINEDYRPITRWTMETLNPECKKRIQGWGLDHRFARFTLFHGSLSSGIDGRIDDVHLAGESLKRMQTDYGLFGHTHYQGYFEQDVDQTVRMFLAYPNGRRPGSGTRSSKKIKQWYPTPIGEWQPLPKHGKALFNPGSVGQPRSHAVLIDAEIPHDYRAAYMLLLLDESGGGAFQFRRVDYDVEETVRLLRAIRWPQRRRSGEGKSSKGEIHLPREEEPPANWEERLSDCVENILIPTLVGKRQ